MKTFLVLLRDDRERCVRAESFHRESGERAHYVFVGTESGDVDWFLADEVISITVVPPDHSQPIEEEDI